MMTLEINPPRHDRRDARREDVASRHLVLVASDPTVGPGGGLPQGPATDPSRSRSSVAGPDGLQCTRVAAHTVNGSAAWHRFRARQTGVSPRFEDPIYARLGSESDRLTDRAVVLDSLDRAWDCGHDHEAIAGAISALRGADAVIVGPLSPDDANAPGLMPHLADLTVRAYRALRPPKELIVHPAFAQIARRFQYIQMTEHEARSLGKGAVDMGVLGQRLRRLQGDPGEFAITAFSGRGLLWADDAWWEIEPIGNVDESVAAPLFCMAWVVARQFRGADVARALAYARAVTAAAVNPARRSWCDSRLG